MTKLITIKEDITISKNIERVWEICALDFQHIDRWDANVKQSIPSENQHLEANVGGRICYQYSGAKTVEKLTEYDEKNNTFTYAITEGLPGFVINAHNRWELARTDINETKLTMKVSIELKGIFGSLMSGMMKHQMSKILRSAQEELKHFIENGSPHPRKQKKQSKTR